MAKQILKPGLSEAQHAALDHTGIEGIGTGGGIWREAVANQAALPTEGNEDGDLRTTNDNGLTYQWGTNQWNRIPIVTPVEHTLLDHTGLQGIPAESTWKGSVSTAAELGEGSEGDCKLVIEENLIYTYHIDGWIIAAPNTGLLNETDHDALDHTGLTGIPEDTNYKGSVADEDALPHVADDVYYSTPHWPSDETSSSAVYKIASWPHAGHGLQDYKVDLWAMNTTMYRVGFQADSAGYPSGTWIAYVDVDVTAGLFEATVPQANLQIGTNYWLVVSHPNDAKSVALYQERSCVGTLNTYWSGGWKTKNDTAPTHRYKSGGTFAYSNGDIVYSLDDRKFYAYNSGTDAWDILNPDETVHTGLLDETAHDALDHTGLTGVPAAEAFTSEIHAGTDHTGLPGVGGSSTGNLTSNNNTVDPSSWRNFQIADFAGGLITKLQVTAIDGNATPDMNYDIELFTDAARTIYAYRTTGITTTNYIDLIPWEWFGGTTIYGKIINNKAAAMTDIDITVWYRR